MFLEIWILFLPIFVRISESQLIPLSCLNDNTNGVDLVFILDSSSSVRQENWPLVLQFCEQIVDRITVSTGLSVHSRVGLVRYADQSESIFHLNSYENRDLVNNAIRQVSYVGGRSRLVDGISTASLNQFNFIRGDRLDAQNIAIVITSNLTTANVEAPAQAAQTAAAQNIDIYAIGVGSGVEADALSRIAPEPRVIGQNYWRLTTHSQLNGLADPLVSSICQKLISTPSPPTPVPTEWGAWGQWSTCSVSCGTGRRFRTRPCLVNNGCTPAAIGLARMDEDCFPGSCQADCSLVVCGNGGRCFNQISGEATCQCTAFYTGVRCQTRVTSEWSAWQQWSPCSSTCGPGTSQRQRVCLPFPEDCTENASERRTCQQRPCYELSWSSWSTCSVSCGSGVQQRVSRSCSGTTCDPAYVPTTQTRACNNQSCPTTTHRPSTTSTTTPSPVLPQEFNSCDRVACVNNTYCDRVENGLTTCRCNLTAVSKFCYFNNFVTDTQIPDWCQRNSGMSQIDICPKFGPITGGTDVFIWGNFKIRCNSATTMVYFANNVCQVVSINSTYIHCISPQLNHTADLSSSTLTNTSTTVDINLHSCNSNIYKIGSFTYRPIPRIASISPLLSIISGGINITVSGYFFDSVSHPVMELREVNSSDVFSTLCHRESDVQLICTTPDFKTPTARQSQRQVRPNALSVFIGFNFDAFNVIAARLVTRRNTHVTLVVTPDPTVDMFEGQSHTRIFRPGWPSNELHLFMKGSHLDIGVDKKDYKIFVAEEKCKNIEILRNTLICAPPKTRPSVINDNLASGNLHPSVRVIIGNRVIFVGNLIYHHWIFDDPQVILAFSLAAVVLGILLLALIGVCFYCIYAPKAAAQSKGFDSLSAPKTQEQPKYTLYENFDRELQIRVDDILLNEDTIIYGATIKTGKFGVQKKGYLRMNEKDQQIEIEIKAFLNNKQPVSSRVKFVSEATSLLGHGHPNVRQPIALLIKNQQPSVIYRIAEFGDLISYFKIISKTFDLRKMVGFCRDIAMGMSYLTDSKHVHGDIAARNCIVTAQHLAKICDPALSRDFYPKDYSHLTGRNGTYPIRWMAPETLDGETSTHESDIWMFGILMWEIVTLGDQPYKLIADHDLLTELHSGKRLGIMNDTNQELASLMEECWDSKPSERPSFREIASCLFRLLGAIATTNPKKTARNRTSDYLEPIDDKDTQSFDDQTMISNDLYSEINNEHNILNSDVEPLAQNMEGHSGNSEEDRPTSAFYQRTSIVGDNELNVIAEE